MNIQALRSLCSTRPQIVLEWAKRFSFQTIYPPDSCIVDRRGPTYDEEALIAFRSISATISSSPSKIIGWLLKHWHDMHNQGGFREYSNTIFGNNPAIEFKNMKQWIEAVFEELMSKKPHLFTKIVESEIGDKTNWDWGRGGDRPGLFREYLKSIHEKKPKHSFDLLIVVWRMRDHPWNYLQIQRIDHLVWSFLNHVYETKPDRFFRFVEQRTKHLNNAKDFGRIVDKVLGLKED